VIVALLNRKGGVGKTSTTHHLAGSLARRGLRVLAVDLDPQASLTQGLLGPAAAAAVPPSASVAAAFLDGDAAAHVRPVRFGGWARHPAWGFDLIPGSHAAADHNTARPDSAGAEQLALRDYLGPIAGGYDAVLVDCPPNLQLLSRAAVAAADGVVVPLQPEDYGAQGIAAVAAEVERVRRGANPGVRLAGYLLTMVSRNALHAAYTSELRRIHGAKVFAAEVPRAVVFVEAVVARSPLAAFRPNCAGAKAIDAVGVELLARLAPAATEGVLA